MFEVVQLLPKIMNCKEPGMMMLPSSSQSQTQVQGFLSFVSTNANANAITVAGEFCRKQGSFDDSESFYMKLTELLESSGLSLIFNVRETLLDLYHVYSEVTRRGGYHQVTQEKKWGEVVSALKLEGSIVKLSSQVEQLYGHLLYKFEQLYFCRVPAKQAVASSTKGPMKSKRNTPGNNLSCQMTEIGLQLTEGAGIVEEPVLLPAPSNDKETKKRRGAPRGQRNPYQIFLKQECARLRSSNDQSCTTVLRTAMDNWRKMSETEKQPYVEESKKSKEKFKEAMIAQNKQNSLQNAREEKMLSICGGDYHVTSQPEAYNYPFNKVSIDLALKMTEKAPKDPLFLVEWDHSSSLDLPTKEQK